MMNGETSVSAKFGPGASVLRYDESLGDKTVVSLFSGCGGMDLGFVGGFEFMGKSYDRLPYRITFANDISGPACRTYRENIGDHIRQGDVASLLGELPESCDILLGGFPCQDVSVNGKRKGGDGHRTILYKRMIEAVSRMKPAVFVAENVKGLFSSDFGRQILDDFLLPGYTVVSDVCLASHWGVPQKRERLLIVGIRDGQTFEFPDHVDDQSVSARAAIGDLQSMEEDADFKHIWSKAKPSPDQGSRKLRPDFPATTMRAEHHGNVQWHYSLPRRISLREQARFQSFPDDFVFPCGMRETERQIGNAVPPVLAWHIANAIGEQVFG